MTTNEFARRRARILFMLVLAAVATLALAAPWAEPVRRAIRPQLPLLVVILAGVSAVAQLVTGVASAWKNGARRSVALPLLLGASALFMALAFLPGTFGNALSLYALIGAALFALAAALLQHRARKRSEL